MQAFEDIIKPEEVLYLDIKNGDLFNTKTQSSELFTTYQTNSSEFQAESTLTTKSPFKTQQDEYSPQYSEDPENVIDILSTPKNITREGNSEMQLECNEFNSKRIDDFLNDRVEVLDLFSTPGTYQRQNIQDLKIQNPTNHYFYKS